MAGNRQNYTLNVPPDLMAALQERHAATYAEHRLPFSAWLRDIWQEWLDTTKEAQS